MANKLKISLKWILAILSVPVVYIGFRMIFILLLLLQHYLKEKNFAFWDETFSSTFIMPIVANYFAVKVPASIAPNNQRVFSVILCALFTISSVFSFLNPHPQTEERYFWLNVGNSIEFLGSIFAVYQIFKSEKA